MSAHCVDNMSEELVNILEGSPPPDLSFDLGIPFLPGDNIFQGINTFEEVIINGNLTWYGEREDIVVTNLNIEDVIMTLGTGTGGDLPSSDRGLVMTADGDNPSLVWDDSEQEFRLGTFDVDTTVTEFPEPSSYANLRVGDISAEAINVNDISVVGAVSTSEVRVGSLKTPAGDDYLASHLIPGNGISIMPQNEGSSTLIVSRPDRIKNIVDIQTRQLAGNTVALDDIGVISQMPTSFCDVFVNGVMVLEGDQFDYTITSEGIKFAFNLEKNDVIVVTAG